VPLAFFILDLGSLRKMERNADADDVVIEGEDGHGKSLIVLKKWMQGVLTDECIVISY
jgi:hypothetical protein